MDRTAPKRQYYYSTATQLARTASRSSSVDRYGRSTIDTLLGREPSSTTSSRYTNNKYSINHAVRLVCNVYSKLTLQYDGDDGYSSGSTTLLRYTRRRPSQDTMLPSSSATSSAHSTQNGYVDDAEAVRRCVFFNNVRKKYSRMTLSPRCPWQRQVESSAQQ